MPCQKEIVNRLLLNDFKAKLPNFLIDEKSLIDEVSKEKGKFFCSGYLVIHPLFVCHLLLIHEAEIGLT